MQKLILSSLQVLAGNARKVSAVRFEQLNNDEVSLETKKVARLVPKIMKRKWSGGEDSDNTEYDGDSFHKMTQDDVTEEPDDSHDTSKEY